jgi:hypothetical protein
VDPAIDWVVKINADAAVGKNSTQGLSQLLPEAILECSWRHRLSVFPGCMEVETLEARACREAISLAKDIAATHI